MTDDRIVDLSYAAAQVVGLNGTGKVMLEAVNAADPQIAQALVTQLQAPETRLLEMLHPIGPGASKPLR